MSATTTAAPTFPATPEHDRWTWATDDGSEPEDGIGYRCHLEPDECGSIDDLGDFYGAIAWEEYDPHGIFSRTKPRPKGFNGAAEKLRIGRGADVAWWQPPPDAVRDRELRDILRRDLCDLLEYGYSGVVVERCIGRDAYGAPIVDAVQSLWGSIEPSADSAYLWTR